MLINVKALQHASKKQKIISKIRIMKMINNISLLAIIL